MNRQLHLRHFIFSAVFMLSAVFLSAQPVPINGCDNNTSSSNCPEVTMVQFAQYTVNGDGTCSFVLEVNYVKNQANNSSIVIRIDEFDPVANATVQTFYGEICEWQGIGNALPDMGSRQFGSYTIDCNNDVYLIWAGHTNPNCGGNCCGGGQQVPTVPTPVEFSGFTGEEMKGANKLVWETASEENTQYYQLERSVNGRNNFEPIGKQGAVGFSQDLIQYELMDYAPPKEAYYRIRSVDFDGFTMFSEVIFIVRESGNKDDLRILGNPIQNEQLQLSFDVTQGGPADITISDLSGQIMYSQNMEVYSGINRTDVELGENFPPAVYVVQIRTREHTYSKMFVYTRK